MEISLENLYVDIGAERVNDLCSHGSPSKWRTGVHTIYSNHPGRNWCTNKKLQNLTRWENDPLQSISRSAQQIIKSRKIASP